MNSVSPVLVDWWIAYFVRKSEIEDDAYQKASGKPTEHTPEEAAKLLESIAGGEQRRSRGTVLQGRPRP
jgi:hypothetical protein